MSSDTPCPQEKRCSVPRKPSIEVTRAYLVTHRVPRYGEHRPGRLYYRTEGDIHAALRAARAIKRRGHGKILSNSKGFWATANATVVVSLTASRRTHKEALKNVRRRPGIKVKHTRVDGVGSKSREKWSWVFVICCPLCGVGVEESEYERRDHPGILCHECKNMAPLELLAREARYFED